MKIRDRLPLLAVLCCFSALLLLPEVSAQAARDAMLLCAQTLIPSLFPFFVLSSLLIACGASELLSALLSPLMRPLFGLSGAGAAALALGLCGGGCGKALRFRAFVRICSMRCRRQRVADEKPGAERRGDMDEIQRRARAAGRKHARAAHAEQDSDHRSF